MKTIFKAVAILPFILCVSALARHHQGNPHARFNAKECIAQDDNIDSLNGLVEAQKSITLSTFNTCVSNKGRIMDLTNTFTTHQTTVDAKLAEIEDKIDSILAALS